MRGIAPRGGRTLGLCAGPRPATVGSAVKREVRLLKTKGLNSLILAVEHFNRPHDAGRPEAVLILLDHSFEMLLKAAILHRGGRVRDPGEAMTIGFDRCVRKALTDASIAFLTDEQALTLQAINGLRDAAQHHLLDISEPQLYLHCQAGVTLFADLLHHVFGVPLAEFLSRRVLPISTELPTDLDVFVEREVDLIRDLLTPGRRRRIEAAARLRALSIVEGATAGERLQPSDAELKRTLNRLSQGSDWRECFPGIASLQLSTEGGGIPFSIRIAKREGVPIQLVPEGTPGASVVAVRRVNELDFYSLGRDGVAQKCGLTPPRTTAVIRHLSLQEDPEYFKRIMIGNVRHDRYSMKAVERIRTEIAAGLDLDQVWTRHGPRRGSAAR